MQGTLDMQVMTHKALSHARLIARLSEQKDERVIHSYLQVCSRPPNGR